MTYQGKNNKTYVLGSKIGSGGDGEVYTITGMPHLLAKIYRSNHFHNSSDRNEMQQKIEAMLTINVPAYQDGRLMVAWPNDILFDNNGSFQGYVMPKATSKSPVLCAFIPTERDRLFGNYSWKYAPKIAYNLAASVAFLHDQTGITLGDMNTENFLIDSDGYITLIDADSFNITHNGHCYKCKAGVPDMLAPELQGKDLALPTTQFTRESDCFSLAVLIFQILVNGVHPFGMPNSAAGGQSSGRNAVVSNIVSGYCPYVTGATNKCNAEAPNMQMFPQYIRALFDRAFDYSAQTAIRKETIAKRPSAREWVLALHKLISDGVDNCHNNSHHTYPKGYSGPCPWCEIEKNRAPIIPVKPYIPHRSSNNQQNAWTNPSTVPNPSYQTQTATNQPSTTRRDVTPLYLLYPTSGCLGTVLMASELSGLSQSMEGMSMSDGTACAILAIVGIIVGIIMAKCVSEHYAYSSYPGGWVALSLVIPIIAFIGSVLLVIGFYLAIAVLVLAFICSIFANM